MHKVSKEPVSNQVDRWLTVEEGLRDCDLGAGSRRKLTGELGGGAHVR